MKIPEIENKIKNTPAILVYFYNDDCPPCISLRPKVEFLIQDKFSRMEVVWVDSKKLPEVPANFYVFSNPTLLLFFDGKETKRFSKYVSLVQLEEAIGRYYEMLF